MNSESTAFPKAPSEIPRLITSSLSPSKRDSVATVPAASVVPAGFVRRILWNVLVDEEIKFELAQPTPNIWLKPTSWELAAESAAH